MTSMVPLPQSIILHMNDDLDPNLASRKSVSHEFTMAFILIPSKFINGVKNLISFKVTFK